MANPAIIVDFVANTKDLAAGFRTAQGTTKSFGDKLKGVGKAGLAAAGAAGLAALTASVKIGIDEFSEASKVSAQTAAAIKSTGGAAGVTAGHIGKLAGSLMKKSGVDDEAIQSGENLLLTFTNIRNEAGRGNDVFDQTTRAALDMSVALGTDMKSASMQLGKALNDPIKGVTKLARSGVTFTDVQKKQIAALQASGKTLEAQKIILAEVNKEFGGSAAAAGKTLPGQINILKESFSNLAGELIGSLVPAFTTLMGVFTKVLGFLGQYKGVLPAIVIALAGLAAATFAVNAALSAWVAITALARAATVAWTAVQWLLNAALLANPIGLVVIAVAALVAAFIVAYKTSDTFRAVVDAAFRAVLDIAMAVFNWLKSNWPLLLGIIGGPVALAAVLVIRYWDQIKSATSAAWNWVRNLTVGVWNSINAAIASAVAAVANAVSGAWQAVRNATSSAWSAVDGVIDRIAAGIKSTISALGSWVSGWASGTWAAITSRIGAFFDNIADGARDAVASVQRNMNALVNAVESIIGRVRNAAESVANGIKAPINAVINAWNGLSFPAVSFTIPGFKIGKKKFGGQHVGFGPFAFPNVSPLAKGGVVTAPTLALVGEAGPEAVIPLDRMVAPAPDVQVRVFIGDQELTSLVRTEIVQANTGLARVLLAG